MKLHNFYDVKHFISLYFYKLNLNKIESSVFSSHCPYSRYSVLTVSDPIPHSRQRRCSTNYCKERWEENVATADQIPGNYW